MSEVLADAVLELMRPRTNDGEGVTTTIADVTGAAARTFDVWAKDHASAFA